MHGLTRTVRDPLATDNERVKLLANSMNAIGLGLIGFALLRPLADDITSASLSTLWWGLGGLAFHGVAHHFLRMIRKEPRE